MSNQPRLTQDSFHNCCHCDQRHHRVDTKDVSKKLNCLIQTFFVHSVDIYSLFYILLWKYYMINYEICLNYGTCNLHWIFCYIRNSSSFELKIVLCVVSNVLLKQNLLKRKLLDILSLLLNFNIYAPLWTINFAVGFHYHERVLKVWDWSWKISSKCARAQGSNITISVLRKKKRKKEQKREKQTTQFYCSTFL